MADMARFVVSVYGSGGYGRTREIKETVMFLNFAEWLLDCFIAPVLFVILLLMAGIAALALISLPFALSMGWKPPSSVAYEQCLADGQKEYVCYSMVYGRGSK